MHTAQTLLDATELVIAASNAASIDSIHALQIASPGLAADVHVNGRAGSEGEGDVRRRPERACQRERRTENAPGSDFSLATQIRPRLPPTLACARP